MAPLSSLYMAESKKKGKKKRFVQVLAPKMFSSQVIGESPVLEPNALLGRKIKVNLMGLTNNPKNQNIQVNLAITSLQGERVGTEITGYTLLPTFVKRMVRKGKRRVDDTFTLATKDGHKIKISPFMITLNATSNSVLTALRNAAHESLKNKVATLSYEAVFNDIVQRKLQSELRRELNKVYPLRQCEIRSIQLTSGDIPQGAGITVEKPAAKPVEVKPVAKESKVESPKEEVSKKAEPTVEPVPAEKPKAEVNPKPTSA